MKTVIIISAAFLLTLPACKKKGCFDSAGTKTISVRSAGAFNEIDSYDNINIVLKQDTTEAITIEAGANLQPYIKADIVNKVLTFRNNSGCSWFKGPSESITAYVSVKTLSNINLHGSGNVSSVNTLTNPEINLDASEAISSVHLDIEALLANFVIRSENPDYTLHGKVNYATVYCGEKGSMDLRDLKVNIMDLDQRSIRDIYIWVTGTLTAKVQYKGNAYYKGNPASITYQHYNDGRLVPLQ